MSTAAHRSGADITSGNPPLSGLAAVIRATAQRQSIPIGMRRGRVKGELTQKVHWLPADG